MLGVLLLIVPWICPSHGYRIRNDDRRRVSRKRATKPALAQAMLERTFAADVPAAWVTADEIYGDAPDLRRWLEVNRHP